MNSAHWRPLRRRPVLLAAAAALALVAAAGALIAAARPGQADAPGPLLPPCKASPLPCYAQDPLHRVYGMGGLYERGITGAGTAIAVIVPYLDPWLRHDLAVYSRRFRLPAPRIQVIDAGHAPAARPGNTDAAAWTQEATADLEVAHFMAPGAQLVYVGIPPTGDAETTAMAALSWLVTHTKVDVVSFSWGEYEPQISQTPRPQRYLATLRAALTAAARAHVTVVAASGDTGPTMPSLTGGLAPGREVAWPAGDPLVTAVGSAAVHANAAGVRLRPDTVGGDDGHSHATGSGLSVLYRRPPWQDRAASVVGGHRGVADIAMSLSAWVYTHFNVFPHHRPGWNVLNGASVSAPMFAGLVACAAQLAGASPRRPRPRLVPAARQPRRRTRHHPRHQHPARRARILRGARLRPAQRHRHRRRRRPVRRRPRRPQLNRPPRTAAAPAACLAPQAIRRFHATQREMKASQ